ncbi:MAG: tetratricopeptide repeat protein [Candidatus Acidiferrum sp.]
MLPVLALFLGAAVLVAGPTVRPAAGQSAGQSDARSAGLGSGQNTGSRAAAARAASKIQIQEHLQKAAGYLKAHDANSAKQEFAAVLAIDPKNAEAYANLGVIAFLQRDYQGAAQDLRKALAIDPSLTKTQALLGISERRMGDPAARVLLEKSFPKLDDKSLRIQVGMELADLYERDGDLDATASVMRSLVELDPDNADILFAAQRIYGELADDTLNKLAIVAPRSARMQQTIAEHLINNGDLPGAIAHYRKALEIDPRIPGVHFELGEAILESAPLDPVNQREAQKEFETAIQSEGDSASVECQLGRIALLKPDVDQAYDHYGRAFALNPADAEAQLGLGRVLATMGQTDEAVKYLRMAVESDPLNGEAHYRLAITCKRLDLEAEAAKEMRLFQEIKQTKENVRELYRQMNKKPVSAGDQVPETQP